MDVTDDVEGAGEVGEVVEPLLQDDLGGLGLLDGTQHVHLAEALALQAAQGAPQVAAVALDDRAGQAGPVGAGRVALGADLLGHVQDDGDGQDVVLAGELDELPAGVGLDAGGVDDGQAAGGEALAGDVVQDVEGVPARALVVLVVADEAAAVVGGDDLGRFEVLAGEGGLARAGGSDQDDEGQVGDGKGPGTGCPRAPGDLGGTGGIGVGHAASPSFGVSVVVLLSVVVLFSVAASWVKTAIWVGGPTSGSSSPTGT